MKWIFAVVIFGFAGCNKTTSLNFKEYAQWMQKPSNGWRAKEVRGGISYEVQCSNPELMVIRSNPNHLKNDSIFEINRSKYAELEYYTLNIKTKSGSPAIDHITQNTEEYWQVQGYLETQIQNDFFLVNESDTLIPAICHAERNYESSDDCIINLAFETSGGQYRKLIYTDQIFQKETIFLEFNRKKAPFLKLV
jgi:hypothetical protein